MQNNVDDYSFKDMIEAIKTKEVKKSLLVSLAGIFCAIAGFILFSGKLQTIVSISGSVITMLGGNRAIHFISDYNASKFGYAKDNKTNE